MLTVIEPDAKGLPIVRGLFIGDDVECFELACRLSAEVNVVLLDEPLDEVVVYLDPDEFHSTWLGNKAIYRTRMAIADGGRLTVLGPGVKMFGEDPEIDRLIRRFGYRTTPEIMQFVEQHEDLRANLSAAAHLIHGSSENRFEILYAAGGLTPREIESVGYVPGDPAQLLRQYPVDRLRDGWNTDAENNRFYFVRNPAMGLWAARDRFVTPSGPPSS